MKFLKKFDLTPLGVLKIAGLILAAIFVLTFAFLLLGSSFNALRGNPSIPSASRSMTEQLDEIIPPTPTPGNDAEEFEVTEYNATIETRNRKDTCSAVSNLKAYDYVIFEQASEYDQGCNYSFKVENSHAGEILAVIKGLEPKGLTESTYTIKKQIEYYTNEIDILEKKLVSINETLENAVADYNDIAAVAARTKDAETLAKIIDSKVKIIERLTQARIDTGTRMEQLARQKAEQTDRLQYTFFYVNVFENKFVDPKDLKDSWKAAIQEFVSDVNQTAQNISIRLAALIFSLVQYAIYFLILLLVAKYGWQLTKYIWKR